MENKNTFLIILALLLVSIALPAGLRLVQEEHEVRREAAGYTYSRCVYSGISGTWVCHHARSAVPRESECEVDADCPPEPATPPEGEDWAVADYEILFDSGSTGAMTCIAVFNASGENITNRCTQWVIWRRKMGDFVGPQVVSQGAGSPGGPVRDTHKCSTRQYWEHTAWFTAECPEGNFKSREIYFEEKPGYVAPTRIPTSTPDPAIPTPTSDPVPDCPRKSEGDANCDGMINVLDFSIWRREKYDLGADEIQGDWQADFNRDGYVRNDDFSIWLNNLE